MCVLLVCANGPDSSHTSTSTSTAALNLSPMISNTILEQDTAGTANLVRRENAHDRTCFWWPMPRYSLMFICSLVFWLFLYTSISYRAPHATGASILICGRDRIYHGESRKLGFACFGRYIGLTVRFYSEPWVVLQYVTSHISYIRNGLLWRTSCVVGNIPLWPGFESERG
jgi:hypothetical protein